jgi:hypothetical protein
MDSNIVSAGVVRLLHEEAASNLQMGSYVNLVFSDACQVEDIHPHLALAAQLAQALEGCEKW